MSAKHGLVDPTVHYVTPRSAVEAVLPHIPTGGVIVDAGCGEGAILAVLAELTRNNYLVGVEIEEARAIRARERLAKLCAPTRGDVWGRVDVGDFRTWECERADCVLTNPPFALTEQFLERALAMVAPSNGTVACLGRLSWHVPAVRCEFVNRHPFDLAELESRPSFVAVLKCGAKQKANRCGWRVMQGVDETRPKVCPGCAAAPVDCNTTDASDFAWMLFGPGRGGRFFRLRPPAPPEPTPAIVEPVASPLDEEKLAPTASQQGMDIQ